MVKETTFKKDKWGLWRHRVHYCLVSLLDVKLDSLQLLLIVYSLLFKGLNKYQLILASALKPNDME